MSDEWFFVFPWGGFFPWSGTDVNHRIELRQAIKNGRCKLEKMYYSPLTERNF